MQFLTDNYEVILAMSSIATLIAILIILRAKSPALQNNARLAIAIALIPTSASFTYLNKVIWNYFLSTDPIMGYIVIIFSSVPTYYLIFYILISFVAYQKKGFTNLKKASENGLVSRLIPGLAIGLYSGSAIGIINAIINTIVSDTTTRESITASAIASAIALVAGLIFVLADGLINGLLGEYRAKYEGQPTSSQTANFTKRHFIAVLRKKFQTDNT